MGSQWLLNDMRLSLRNEAMKAKIDTTPAPIRLACAETVVLRGNCVETRQDSLQNRTLGTAAQYNRSQHNAERIDYMTSVNHLAWGRGWNGTTLDE